MASQSMECCLHISSVAASQDLQINNDMIVINRDQGKAIQERCLDWLSKPLSTDQHYLARQLIARTFLSLWQSGEELFVFDKSCRRKFMDERMWVRFRDSDDDSIPEHVSSLMASEMFTSFCNIVVERRMRKDQWKFRMTGLVDIFNKLTEKYDGGEKLTVTKWLKLALQTKYPDLIFVPSSRRQSEIVMFIGDVAELLEEDLIVAECVSDIESSQSQSQSTLVSSQSQTQSLDHSTMFPDKVFDVSQAEMRALYHAAVIIHRLLIAVKSLDLPVQNQWPVLADHLTQEALRKQVPYPLLNFLAWSTGKSPEFCMDRVSIPDKVEAVMCSIGQDLLYHSFSGHLKTVKQVCLSIATNHLSGSNQLLDIMHGFGVCLSISSVLRLETDLALRALSEPLGIPEGAMMEVMPFLVYDNFDLLEETVTGSGTSHHANGVLAQNQERFTGKPKFEIVDNVIKSSKLTLPSDAVISGVELEPYLKPSSRQGPCLEEQLSLSITSDQLKCLNWNRLLNSVFYSLKTIDIEHQIPDWTGFSTMIHREVPFISFHGPLPFIDANVTQLATAQFLLFRSLKIADRLSTKSVVVIADLALYAKLQEVRWANPEMRARIIVLLGGLHTAMSFLGVVGKRVSNSGFEDLVVEAEIISRESLKGVLSGKHYNRAMRTHKTVQEALHTRLIQRYIDSLPEEDATKARCVLDRLSNRFFQGEFDQSRIPEDFQSFFEGLNDYISRMSSLTPVFAYWMSYLDLFDDFLGFIRAERTGNWNLHLAAVQRMLPWLFEYDHGNYSRYLTAYALEMTNLETSHPDVLEVFQKSEWVFTRQRNYGFAAISGDHLIESTINKDSKGAGGIRKFSLQKGAVQRNIAALTQKSMITKRAKEISHSRTDRIERRECGQSAIARHNERVASVGIALDTMVDPWTCELDVLISISTGVVVSDSVRSDLSKASESGSVSAQAFADRIANSGPSSSAVFAVIPQSKSKTFSSVLPSSVDSSLMVEGTDYPSITPEQAVTRNSLLPTDKQVSLARLVRHSLNSYPEQFFKKSKEGAVVMAGNDNKSAFGSRLESGLPLFEGKGSSEPVRVVNDFLSAPQFESQSAAIVIDGMAVMNKLRFEHQSTFCQVADGLLRKVCSLARKFVASRLDIVFDEYVDHGIKDCERAKRVSKSRKQPAVIRITGKPEQKIPSDFSEYLSSSANKTDLLNFIVDRWCSSDISNTIGDLELLVSSLGYCHRIVKSRCGSSASPVPSLANDHLEADTRMFLHSQHCKDQLFGRVYILSDDTDVLVISLAAQFPLAPVELHIVRGNWSSLRDIKVSDVLRRHHLDQIMAKALVSFYVFTGCDTVSGFFGKGKGSVTNLYRRPDFIETFLELGENWTLSEQCLRGLERFTLSLYSKNEESRLDSIRVEVFRAKRNLNARQPPNYDSFECHARRANYQAGINRRCTQREINAPDPAAMHGWRKVGDAFFPVWGNLPPAPEILLRPLVTCGCKTGCTKRSCSCRSKGGDTARCNPGCKCVNCEIPPIPFVFDQNEESSSDSDSDDSDS